MNMKLEEAHKYVMLDYRGKLTPLVRDSVSKEDYEYFCSLFFDISALLEGDKDLVDKIRNNPLVNKLTKKGDDYRINTKFGEGVFFSAFDIFGEEETKSFIKPNNCHGNSLNAALIIDQVVPERKPVVYTGIACLPFSKPFLHSVYCLDFQGIPIVIDYTYNIAMSEDLFNKMYHFKVLNKTSIDAVNKMSEIDCKYKEYLKLNKCKGTYYGLGIYFLLSNDGMMQYLIDVMDGKRKDNFHFLTDKDFQKKISRIRKRTSK